MSSTVKWDVFSRNESLIYQCVILGLIRYDTDNNQKCVFILNLSTKLK